MEQLGVTNLSAYLRKMAVNGYIINLDIAALLFLFLLRRKSCRQNKKTLPHIRKQIHQQSG